jgi:hypothetical protein
MGGEVNDDASGEVGVSASYLTYGRAWKAPTAPMSFCVSFAFTTACMSEITGLRHPRKIIEF